LWVSDDDHARIAAVRRDEVAGLFRTTVVDDVDPGRFRPDSGNHIEDRLCDAEAGDHNRHAYFAG
jgi:hypothetical protein